jgi:hypothetical protein
MNFEPETDPLRELWRRQPLPPARAETEARILRAVENLEAELKTEIGLNQRYWWLPPLLLLPGLLLSFFVENLRWSNWLSMVLMWAVMFASLLIRRRALRYERDFGSTVLERIERSYKLLRLALRWSHVSSALFVPVIIAIIALLASEYFGATKRGIIVVVFVTALGFGALWILKGRPWYQQCKQRLADLEAMRRELTG